MATTETSGSNSRPPSYTAWKSRKLVSREAEEPFTTDINHGKGANSPMTCRQNIQHGGHTGGASMVDNNRHNTEGERPVRHIGMTLLAVRAEQTHKNYASAK